MKTYRIRSATLNVTIQAPFMKAAVFRAVSDNPPTPGYYLATWAKRNGWHKEVSSYWDGSQWHPVNHLGRRWSVRSWRHKTAAEEEE